MYRLQKMNEHDKIVEIVAFGLILDNDKDYPVTNVYIRGCE